MNDTTNQDNTASFHNSIFQDIINTDNDPISTSHVLILQFHHPINEFNWQKNGSSLLLNQQKNYIHFHFFLFCFCNNFNIFFSLKLDILIWGYILIAKTNMNTKIREINL